MLDQTNLDIYGDAPLPWSRAEKQLEATGGTNLTHFLATVRPDGRPHVAGVGALWVDGKFYFTSGPRLRKSRNLATNPRGAVSVSLDDIDVAVQGAARKVTDPDTLERVANVYASLGWPAQVSAGAITARIDSPHFPCGTPITAHSSTSGCSMIDDSTSGEYTFSPPGLIMSFLRSRM